MTLRILLGLLVTLAAAAAEERCRFCEVERVLGKASAAELAARELARQPHDLAAREHLIVFYARLDDEFRLKKALDDWAASPVEKTPLFWLQKGGVAWRAERWDEAVGAWQNGATLPGGTACVNELLARRRKARDWEGMEKILSDAIAVNGESFWPLVMRYEVRMRLKRFDKAGEDIRRAGEMAPDEAVVKKHYPAWERFEAIKPRIVELGLEIEASNAAEPLVNRARLFLEHGLDEAALADIRVARSRLPSSKALGAVEAQLILKAGYELDEAKKIEPKLKTTSGILLWSPGELARFLSIESKLGGDRPDAAIEAALQRAAAFREWGQPALALDDAEAALAKGAAGAVKGRALGEKANALVSLGQSAEGFRVYREAFDAGLEDGWLLKAAAEHAKSRGELGAVIAFGERGHRSWPNGGMGVMVEEAKLVRDRKEWQ